MKGPKYRSCALLVRLMAPNVWPWYEPRRQITL